jgi:CPA2 family monovalent cation:H+ antiporter-2
VGVLTSLQIPLLVIEADAKRVASLNAGSIATLYGDAANSEVITHAHLGQARALVVTVPEESAAAMIVGAARRLNPDLPVLVRAATEEGVDQLAGLGADHIVHPELEGGLELVHHTLLELGFPLREVHAYSEAVRRDRYNLEVSSNDEHLSLHDLLIATDSIQITWLKLESGSPVVGRTLEAANLRSETGASVVAIIRDNQLIANPKSSTIFEAGDRVGLIGEKEQIETAQSRLKT